MSTDLAVLDVADVELAADPAGYVLQACERAKVWLAHALEHGGIEQIVELKSQAEAIRVYTMSKQLGKDAQLAAAEIVRRAERGIGLAIRKGQELGEIRRQGQGRGYTHELPPPTAFASADELRGNQAGIYDMTDGVSDEEFNAAVAEGKAEGNLSRANVVRKVRGVVADPGWIPDTEDRTADGIRRRRELIRQMAGEGYSSTQISARIGTNIDRIRLIARELRVEIPADVAIGKGGRRIDPNRVIRETVHALDGLAMGVDLVIDDLSGLDPAEIPHWVASLIESTRVLNRLVKQMKEMTQ